MTTAGSREPVGRIIDLANSDDFGEREPGERGVALDVESVEPPSRLIWLERRWALCKQWLADSGPFPRAAAVLSIAFVPAGITAGVMLAVKAHPLALALLSTAALVSGSVIGGMVTRAVRRTRQAATGKRDEEHQRAKRTSDQRLAERPRSTSIRKIKPSKRRRRARRRPKGR